MNDILKQTESINQKSLSAAGLAALSENLFLLFLAAYLVRLALGTTTFVLELPRKIDRLILISLLAAGFLKLALQFAAADREGRIYRLKTVLASLPVSLMWMLVYRNDGYDFLPYLAILTVACIGTEYRKILKAFVLSVGTVVLAAVLCSFSGSIANRIYQDPTRLRSSWGICYPTDFSAVLVFLCLAAWIAWRDVPDLFFLLPGTLSLIIAKEITGSNTGVICSTLFLAAVILSALLRDKEHRVPDTLIRFASAASFPLLGVGMIAMTWAYHEGNAFAQKFDLWNHFRLSSASAIFDEVGLSLFGVPFRQSGYGGWMFGNEGYHFVDCSYLLILLRYGVVCFAVLALLWVLMTGAAAKLRDRRLLLAFMVIAVHCVSEHHYTELNYNPFVVLPFALLFSASLPVCEPEAQEMSNRQRWGQTGVFLAVSAVFTVVVIWAFPGFTTLCTLYNLGGSFRHRRFLFAAVFAGLLLLLLFTALCTRLLLAVTEKRKPSQKSLLSAGALALCFLGGLIAANNLLDRAGKVYGDTLEKERPVVEAIQSSGVNLYVDNLPALYRRAFGGIDRSLYHGEDLARQSNLAVITDADRELNILISRGFRYGEISEDQAVYTDSPETEKALQAAGVCLHGWYSRNRALDLNELSWAAYGEALKEEGTVNLTECGPIEKSVKNDLYAAAYRITYDLRLESEPDSLPAPDDPVCTLRVVCYPEGTFVAERDVLFSEFREDGTCTAALDIVVSNVYEAEFLITPKDCGGDLLLQGIRYQKREPVN